MNALGLVLTIRGADIAWRHPAELLPGDVNCDGMSEAEFELAVCRALGIFGFCKPQQEQP